MCRTLFGFSAAREPPAEGAATKGECLHNVAGSSGRSAMSATFQIFHLHASRQIQPADSKLIASSERLQNVRPTERPKPELAFYRKYTEAMLRRYARLSLSTGRMPALLGHDAFRGKMSTYRVRSFEDSVIFVYDVDKCLKKLDAFSHDLIRRIAIQEFTQGEAAGLLRVSLRTIVRKYGEAIDRLTQLFLDHKLLDIDPLGESTE
jgi:hypothetical protein